MSCWLEPLPLDRWIALGRSPDHVVQYHCAEGILRIQRNAMRVGLGRQNCSRIQLGQKQQFDILVLGKACDPIP